MAVVSPKSLLETLNPTCKRALEAAAGLCISRTHFSVEIEHWLFKLIDNNESDLHSLLRPFNLDANKVRNELEAALRGLKTGNARSPGFAVDVLDLIREAWTIGSAEFRARQVRSGFLLLALLSERTLSMRLSRACPELAKLSVDTLLAKWPSLQDVMPESDATEEQALDSQLGGRPVVSPNSKTPNLDQYTVNLTAAAAAGKIDPVLGRDAEIRQVMDVLLRRRQNNPLLTGEAGVGKTAVVEGLALRIRDGDVPEPLKAVVLRTLDLGLLQAGAGVKGEFENRLKSVIQEVKASPVPIILFIDEAHTLIGAGGASGQNDAANLLKPALARGELRTIAATTFAEYKKYFQGDAALKRRFQQIKVEEPDEATAIRMVRGLVPMLQKHHGVRILDEAVADAVRLSLRYMTDRQLPDKAVSLLDTVCARVALSQSSTPAPLEDTLRLIDAIDQETELLTKENQTQTGHGERLAKLQQKRAEAEVELERVTTQLDAEREVVKQLHSVEKELHDAKDPAPLREKLLRLQEQLGTIQGERPLMYPLVNRAAVAEVVSRQTGIPLGNMVRNEVSAVLSLADRLNKRVVGQRHALEAIAQRIRTARADLADPRRPQGVFLLVGPSGVGKTETALALADLLYGGERNMVIVNMSEYKESHKVSRLVGTSKGYVGYGEGGVLTNAVKNRPYSVVLLDEVEKAHEGVQEIFYQVFDKGVLQNDDGEDVNFKNTIILLTANVGTDTIMKACADPDTVPSAAALAEILKPDLLKAFKPALLGRMTVVPYFPLAETVLKDIIRLKLGHVGKRLHQTYGATLDIDPAVMDAIAARCTDVDSGARNVDHIIAGSVLPALSDKVLNRLFEGQSIKAVKVELGADGAFEYVVN
jgi:type VI secretion system protein VasG